MSAARRELKLVIEPGNLALFLRIAHAVSAEIQAGRLPVGARLPGTRTLSEQLSVHRSTVEAAFEELRQQGWLETRAGSGTYVSQRAPIKTKSAEFPAARPSEPGFEFAPAPPTDDAAKHERGVLRFSGAPDVRVMPIDLVARAYRRAQSRRSRDAGQSDPMGHERLRAAVANMLSVERGLSVTPAEVMIVPRSTLAVELVMRSLARAGDAVAVEELSHRPVREILERHEARLVSLPVDAEGVRVEALEAATEQHAIRGAWVTPQCQYPTNVVLSAARRKALLSLAQRKRFAVIESDYLHDFHYGSANPPPLASADSHGHVVYLGSLSRVLAPDVQLGYVVAPPAFLESLARRRQRWGERDDAFAYQVAVAELLEDGDYRRSLRRALTVYRQRRDVLAATLRSRLGDVLTFNVPESGTALWAKVSPRVDVEQWAMRALAKKVQFRTARHFANDDTSRPFARFGFTQLDENQIAEAVERLVAAL